MTLDIARRVIEEKRKLGIDVAVAVRECVDMTLCTQGEAAQLLQEYGIVAAERLLQPILQINWGIDPKPGPHLTPEFTILGLDTKVPPIVDFPLDKRIQCADWNSTPTPERNSDGYWRFYQSLRLEESGQYLLKVTLIDSTPGQMEPSCYRCDFRVTVPDANNAGQSRTLEISADGLLTANLPNLAHFQHVKINAGSNVLVNTPGESNFDEKLMNILQPNRPTNDSSLLMSIKFVPAKELAWEIPYIRFPRVQDGISRAILTIPGQPVFHLIAGNELTFGRDVPEEKHCNDVPLVISPNAKTDDAEAESLAWVSLLFSREHARLEVTSNGVCLCDERKSGMDEGTLINGKPLKRNDNWQIFDHGKNLAESQIVLYAKMLEMEIIPHFESFRENMSDKISQPILERLYQSGVHNDARLSAINIKHCKYLKQYEHSIALQVALRKTPLVGTDWLGKWLQNQKYANPHYGKEERFLIMRFVTLGGMRQHTIKLPGHAWRNAAMRILNINGLLYLENISPRELSYHLPDGNATAFPPFRPIPVQPNLVIRQENSEFQFR